MHQNRSKAVEVHEIDSPAKKQGVGIMSFMRYEATDFGLIATAAIIIALPVVLFSYVVRRYLVAGIMTGAVK